MTDDKENNTPKEEKPDELQELKNLWPEVPEEFRHLLLELTKKIAGQGKEKE